MRAKGVHAFLLAMGGLLLFVLGAIIAEVSTKQLLFFVLGLVALALVTLPMQRAFQVFFIYLGFEGFAKLITNYNPVVHVGSDLLILAMSARVIASSIFYRKQLLPEKFPPFFILFVLHFVWFIITIANPYALGLIASLAASKMYVTTVLLYFFGYYLSKDLPTVRSFMMPWLIICLLQSVASIYQASIGPASVESLGPQFVERLKFFGGYAFRPFGLTHFPGAPSVYMMLSSSLIVYFLFHGTTTWSRILALALLPLTVVTLLVCQVRALLLKSILAAAAYLLVTLQAFRQFPQAIRRKIVVFSLFMVIASVVAIPKMLDSVIGSNDDNKRALERSMSLFEWNRVSRARQGALDRFVYYVQLAPLGAGLSRTGAASNKFQALAGRNDYFEIPFFSDNLWVALVVDLGIPGVLIITLILLVVMLKGVIDLLRMREPAVKAVQGAILCALFVIIIGGYGGEAMLYNPEASFFWFFAGAMIKLPEIAAKTQQQASGFHCQKGSVILPAMTGQENAFS